MNALVVLLMTSVPAADPYPTTQAAPAPIPSYSYGQTSWSAPAEESRPRFFGRVRGIFRRRSQNGGQAVPDSVPAYSSNWSALGTMRGTVPAPAGSSPALTPAPTISSGPAGSSLTPPTSPAYSTPESSPAQRMPSREAPF